MRVHFQCGYCGDSWEKIFQPQDRIMPGKCTICGEENNISREKTKIIDTYVGCPPFAEPSRQKEAEEEQEPELFDYDYYVDGY